MGEKGEKRGSKGIKRTNWGERIKDPEITCIILTGLPPAVLAN